MTIKLENSYKDYYHFRKMALKFKLLISLLLVMSFKEINIYERHISRRFPAVFFMFWLMMTPWAGSFTAQDTLELLSAFTAEWNL